MCINMCQYVSDFDSIDGVCGGHKILHPRRCKTSSVGQSAGLSVPRSSVRFRQKLKKKTRTQIYMDLRYIDPQARVINYCFE